MNPVGPPEIGAGAVAAVALVIVVGLLANWWLRGRSAVVGGGSVIRVVATRSLGGKRAVAVVEVERERFLLGLTDDLVSCLSRLERPASGGPA